MPLFIDCVENDITFGEICNTPRGVWGDAQRVAEGFKIKGMILLGGRHENLRCP